MRITMILASALSVLALSACGQTDGRAEPDGAPKAAAGAPDRASLEQGPTPGLWRVTTSVGDMTLPPVESCIREAKFETPVDADDASGMNCSEETFRREGGALVGQVVCTSSAGERTVTDMRVTGDLSRRYTMEMKSTTTPASDPSMAGMTMVMNAERLGDCPAGSASE